MRDGIDGIALGREDARQARAEFERLTQRLGLSPGREIDGRYRIERLLGRGAMGEVFLVHDRRLVRRVALKLVRGGVTTERLQARLQREALALARVEHPNVIGIYDVGSHDGQTYFTMQFVPGTILRVWQLEPRTLNLLLDVYLQAARGLDAAHRVGVIHRDFKPDNVIVGDDGIVRVLDFGLAAALQDDQSQEDTLTESDGSSTLDPNLPRERMTQTGALLGTLPYMSSEQLEGREADARSDQFGFCVALWEALTGARPFEGRESESLRKEMASGPNGAQRLPRWMRSILVRGLAEDPQRRWPSMNELIRAIERGRTRGRKLLLGLGLGAAVLVVGQLGRAASSVERDAARAIAPIEACDHFVAEIDQHWGAHQHESILAGDPLAARYSIETMDAFADDWRSAAAARCEDGNAPPAEQPERVCLERWLTVFGETVELLIDRSDDRTLAVAPDLLARLNPPNHDYCAGTPSVPIDSEVWRLAERARALAIVGDLEAAVELADEAIQRAEQLSGDAPSGESAIAHAARAEVAAKDADSNRAEAEFSLAQHHALATESQQLEFSIWLAWAKFSARNGGPEQAALAFVRIEQAESRVYSFAADDPRRAQLLDARGLAERARGNHEQAIADHRAAQARFMAVGQPTLAAMSLINIGANQQELGEAEHARRSYLEALEVLDAARLPPRYRHRVLVERNLGLLDYMETEHDAIAKGLPHFEFVLEHGNEAERFEAHELILALVLELDDPELARHWTERALQALDARPGASDYERFTIQRAAGIALAYADDPRGEELLRAAERSAASLPRETRLNLQVSWINWLEEIGRCAEAHERRERVAAELAKADAQLAGDFEPWSARGPQGRCASEIANHQPEKTR